MRKPCNACPWRDVPDFYFRIRNEVWRESVSQKLNDDPDVGPFQPCHMLAEGVLKIENLNCEPNKICVGHMLHDRYGEAEFADGVVHE